MTAKTLEQEANEASLKDDRGFGFKRSGEFLNGFERGYLAAATARDKEIERLRARVAELEGMVPKWAEMEGCDCGQNDPPCALCIGKAFLEATNEDPA